MSQTKSQTKRLTQEHIDADLKAADDLSKTLLSAARSLEPLLKSNTLPALKSVVDDARAMHRQLMKHIYDLSIRKIYLSDAERENTHMEELSKAEKKRFCGHLLKHENKHLRILSSMNLYQGWRKEALYDWTHDKYASDGDESDEEEEESLRGNYSEFARTYQRIFG